MDWFNEMYLRVSATLRSLRDHEEGQAMVEYAILIGLITAGVVALILGIGGWVETQFQTVSDNLGIGG